MGKTDSTIIYDHVCDRTYPDLGMLADRLAVYNLTRVGVRPSTTRRQARRKR